MPDLDPNQLAQLLAAGAGAQPNIPPAQALQPNPAPDLGGAPQGTPPILPSQQQQPAVPAPDFGSGTLNEPSGIGPTPKPQPSSGPPKQSTVPALYGFMRQMFGGQDQRGYYDAPAGQPGRPVSRMDAFENFLGNFLSSFATGMQQGGTGPGASGRGFGAAVNAPYQKQVGQYQLQQQGQLAQAQAAEAQGRGSEAEARAAQMGQMVTLPNGVTMPMALAQKVYPATIAAQAKVQAAGTQKQFLTTSMGVFDTKTGKYVNSQGFGPTALVSVNDEMAQQYGLPQELIGKQIKLSDLANLEKGAASQVTPVQGAAGPALANKISGKVTPLRLGSPAANAVAMANLDLRKQAFERDTFGTLYGKLIPSTFINDDGQSIGWKSPSAPTGNVKTQGQTAVRMLPILDEAERQLALANKSGLLGPGAGRLNEFLTGKVGADNPQFAELRSIVALSMTGLLKAHFGTRAPVQMFDHFNDLINAGKMTYGDLSASLKSFRFVMQDYAKDVRTAGSGGGGETPKNGNAAKIDFTPIK
jgi:hypothetical protein